jgi:hypothetical protein
MVRRVFPFGFSIVATLVAALGAGCGSSGSGSEGSADVLDPTQPHYGNTDAQWGVEWWQWVYQLPETANSCIIPFEDPTGANCGYGQSGDVFFLAGTSGGTAVRDQCVVPAGKAIFFPILSFSADNGGVPASMQLSPTALQGVVQTEVDGVPVSGLSAEFDGKPIVNLAQFKTAVTQFSYTLPPEPNVYTCGGATGVTGIIDPSFEAGFYVMLPPPAPGAHTLHFAGNSPATSPAFMLDVTYHLTVM